MKTEFEAKFYPVNKDSIREKLRSIGATLAVQERLMRRMVFDELKNPGINVTYLRVRDEGDVIKTKCEGTCQGR